MCPVFMGATVHFCRVSYHDHTMKKVSEPIEARLRPAAVEHLDALFGYAMTLTRDKSEAEDLVQETYLRAVSSFWQFEPGSNLKGWLFVIMRNAWLNQVRHKQSGPRFVEIENAEKVGDNGEVETATNPHVVYLRNLERRQIHEAIENLPDTFREVIVLRDLEGFSYQEIARVLDCPAGTVMSRLGRAREKLRRALVGWQTKKRAKAV
jgi:RNA polymerase sigma-70 factor, ECF subfamily